MAYSEVVMDHFKNPRNVGEMKDADGVGEVGNPICGDMMSIFIKVKDDRINDIKFLTFGCGAAIAVSSMVTEMAKGKSLEDARKITNKSVAQALAGLPTNKLHCSNLGADALHAAIQNYLDLNPVNLPIVYSLAGCLYAQSKQDEAAEQCRKILLFEPDNQMARELLEKIEGKGEVCASASAS